MKRASNGYSKVITPLFETMLVQDQADEATFTSVDVDTGGATTTDAGQAVKKGGKLRKRKISTVSGDISTAEEPVNTAGASKPVSTAGMVQERVKDKGKAIMQESEQPRKIKKKEYQQISLDEEIAQKLYVKELAKDIVRQEQERYNLK
ncbi:hypothetical protein Tco_1573818, partial [Tanacetum coccineum]